jgi:hypothetical protein
LCILRSGVGHVRRADPISDEASCWSSTRRSTWRQQSAMWRTAVMAHDRLWLGVAWNGDLNEREAGHVPLPRMFGNGCEWQPQWEGQRAEANVWEWL